MITFLAFHFFLFLGLDLNRVLQQGHVISCVRKNREHNEHHFWPILYRRLFVKEVDLNLLHNPGKLVPYSIQFKKIFKRISKFISFRFCKYGKIFTSRSYCEFFVNEYSNFFGIC